MKPNPTLLRGAVAALSLAASAASWSAVDVGVGVTIREPGVYGRIEIGTSAPPPPVIYRRPIVVTQPAVVVVQPQPPLYLYVPPGHAKKWRKHCRKYDACGREVYFVREEWVQTQYRHAHPRKGAPVYVDGRGRGHGHGKHRDDD